MGNSRSYLFFESPAQAQCYYRKLEIDFPVRFSMLFSYLTFDARAILHSVLSRQHITERYRICRNIEWTINYCGKDEHTEHSVNLFLIHNRLFRITSVEGHICGHVWIV